MKKTIRYIVAFLIVSPFMILFYLLRILLKKERIFQILGPLVTNITKQTLRVWAPSLNNPKEFDLFPSKMKKNFWIWKPFYDFEIVEETKDTLKFHVWNCPFCEVLNYCNLSDLSPYLCQADWEYAKEHKDQWNFERHHEIGTGDSFCDHTYKRLDN
jgi:hypothetical protein